MLTQVILLFLILIVRKGYLSIFYLLSLAISASCHCPAQKYGTNFAMVNASVSHNITGSYQPRWEHHSTDIKQQLDLDPPLTVKGKVDD